MNDENRHPTDQSSLPVTAVQLLRDSRLLHDHDAVNQALDSMALHIDEQLQGHNDQPWVLIAVLKGGMLPASWLAQRLRLDIELDYVHATRYRGATRGGELHWQARPSIDLTGRSVLLVDDIFDEGYTMAAIADHCREAGAAAIRSAVLVRKQHDRGLSRDWVDYAAMEIPDEYVFGCGMDIFEHWRHLPEIRIYTGEH